MIEIFFCCVDRQINMTNPILNRGGKFALDATNLSAISVPIALGQEALNTWSGNLFHFFHFLNNPMYPKMIVISFVHLKKRNKYAKFGGCGSKKAPITP